MQTQNKPQFNEKANILVKNIHKDISQGEIFNLFKSFGKITSCKLDCYQDGTSRG
jgi:RNA recognition motif-containing protein